MKTKTIHFLAAYCLTKSHLFTAVAILIPTALFYACLSNPTGNNAEKSLIAVQRVLMLDDSLGKKRNRECQEISLNETIDHYIEGLKAASFKGCPGDFKKAFNKHIRAWENVKQSTGKYPALRGEMHNLFRQIKQGPDSTAFNRQVAEIWSTWDEIELVKTRTTQAAGQKKNAE